MRPQRFAHCYALLLLLTLAWWWDGSPIAWGQELSKETSTPGVEEVGPTTVYLKDEKGKLVPVPGISYERFRDLLLLERRLGSDAPPSFVLERIRISGNVRDSQAELLAEISITTRQTGWSLVPLGLPNALLRGAIESNGSELVHRFDVKGGHVLWLNANESKRCVIKLPLLAPIKRLGLERQLALTLPKASEAELTLQVPYRIADFELTAGEGIAEKAASKDASTLKVLAASGDLAVSWKSANDLASHAAHDLETQAAMQVRVETRDIITLECLLKMKRVSRAIDTVFVRLPPRFEPVLKSGGGVTMALATNEDLTAFKLANRKLPPGSLVRLDFDRPDEQCEVTLTADYKPENAAKRSPVEVGGFEVLDAGRQTGQINIALPKSWLLKPTTDSAVFRIDDPAADTPQEQRPAAIYRFVKQPFSLKFDLLAQPTRTTVEATHVARIEKRLGRMKSSFRFRVRGPRPEWLDFDLADWNLVAVEPAELVSLEAPPEAGKPARLRLQPGGSTDINVQLQLQKEWNAANEVAFDLPRAAATQLLPATLSVQPGDDVRLQPKLAAMTSLLADDRLSAAFEAPAAQGALAFRELPHPNEKTRFLAELKEQSRRVTVSATGQIHFQPQRAEVEQRWELNVVHQPLTTLLVDVPAGVDPARLRFSQDNVPLTVRALDQPGNEPTVERWEVLFPEPVLGTTAVFVKYEVPFSGEDTVALPLVLPTEETGLEITRQILRWRAPPQQLVLVLDEQITAIHVPTPGNDQEISWSDRTSYLRFLRQELTSEPTEVFVTKAWLQICLAGGQRRDRFVAEFTGGNSALEINLPVGVEPANTRVLIDGAPPTAVRWKDGRLLIGLSPDMATVRRLELWYLLPSAEAAAVLETRALPLPRFAGPSTPQHFFLQILTPPSQVVLWSPAGFASYMGWRKRGLWWERAGLLDIPELENMFQVGPETPLEFQQHESLFVGLGAPAAVELVLGRSRWLWVYSAGGVLIGGWLVLLLSRGRRVILLTVIAAGLLGLVLLLPDAALSLSSYLGLGLLLLFASTWSIRFAGSFESARPSQPRGVSRVSRSESRSRSAIRPTSKSQVGKTLESTTLPHPLKEARP